MRSIVGIGKLSIVQGLHSSKRTRFSGGYLLPAVIALGLGISTVSVLALQTVTRNSTTLNTQNYNQLAREAAQAGIAAAQSCIASGAMAISGSPSWDSTPLTPDKDCTLKSVIGRPSTVAGSDSSNPSGDLYTTTYSVDKPDVQGSQSNAYLITSVGTTSIKGPGGTVVGKINQTVRAFGTTTPGVTLGSFKTVSSLSTGPSTACVVTTGGDNWVYCWGDDSNNQLGIGKNVNGNVQSSPIAVANGPVAAQASSPNPCGGFLQPGCSRGSSPYYPANPMSGKKVLQVSVGVDHTCARASEMDGSNPRAYCWGSNNNGQLGNYSNTDSPVPVAVDTTGYIPGIPGYSCGFLCYVNPVPAKPASSIMNKDVIDISAGNRFTCALTSDGIVSCWGTNGNGQLGTGDRTSQNIPTSVERHDYIPGVPGVPGYSCGFLCYVNPVPAIPAVPASIFWTKKATKLAINKSADVMCAMMDDQSAACWGENYSGQTGNNRHAPNESDSACSGGQSTSVPPISTAYDALSPAAVDTTQKFDSITLYGGSDYGYASAHTSDTKRMYWWGGSTSGNTTKGSVCGSTGGQSGSGVNKYNWTSTRSYASQDTPAGPLYNSSTTPPTINGAALALTSGNAYNDLFCAQLPTSELYCDSHGSTSNSNDGQLGNGYVLPVCTNWLGIGCPSGTNFTTPQQVAANNTTYSIDGQTVSSDIAGQSIVAMDTGTSGYTCVVTTPGRVACWGVNSSGQLGVGDTKRRAVPTNTDVSSATSSLYFPGGTTQAGRVLNNVILF